MASTGVINVNPHKYYVIDPDGNKVPVTKRVFDLVKQFVVDERNTGSVTINFKSGGVSSVEVRSVYV